MVFDMGAVILVRDKKHAPGSAPPMLPRIKVDAGTPAAGSVAGEQHGESNAQSPDIHGQSPGERQQVKQ